jgi:hypothetical protein
VYLPPTVLVESFCPDFKVLTDVVVFPLSSLEIVSFLYIIINMKTLAEKIASLSYYRDTPPAVENIQVNLLREAGAAKRFSITLSLTQRIIALSKQALKKANPGLSDNELKILFIKNSYGISTAEKVKKRMIEKGMYAAQ